MTQNSGNHSDLPNWFNLKFYVPKSDMLSSPPCGGEKQRLMNPMNILCDKVFPIPKVSKSNKGLVG